MLTLYKRIIGSEERFSSTELDIIIIVIIIIIIIIIVVVVVVNMLLFV
jgi:nitrate reductase gamma subunit